MENLTTFMLCDTIESKINGTSVIPSIIAPQLVLRPLFVPSAISFAIVLGISNMNLTEQNKIIVKIKNPDDELIQEIVNDNLPPAPNDPNLPSNYAGCIMCVDIRNLVVKVEGAYPVEVYVNDNKIGDTVIPVFKRQSQE